MYLYGISVLFLFCLEVAMMRRSRSQHLIKLTKGTMDNTNYQVNSGFSVEDGVANGQAMTGRDYSTINSIGSLDMFIVTPHKSNHKNMKHRISLPLRIGITGGLNFS